MATITLETIDDGRCRLYVDGELTLTVGRPGTAALWVPFASKVLAYAEEAAAVARIDLVDAESRLHRAQNNVVRLRAVLAYLKSEENR